MSVFYHCEVSYGCDRIYRLVQLVRGNESMCHGMSYGPPYGIPIPPDVHDRYSDELKKAWVTFHAWVKAAQNEDRPLRRSEMPTEVGEAMELILETPIPVTGADSCYMVSIQEALED